MNTDIKHLFARSKIIQRELVLKQIEISNIFEEEKEKLLKLEKVTNGIKITLPEYPPGLDVYEKIIIAEDGRKDSRAYTEARVYWNNLIRKVSTKYNEERIDPCIIYIKYLAPWKCRVSDFTPKFIIDGLVLNKFIAANDNFQNVNYLIQSMVIEKDNPRTEIFVIKNKKQMEELFAEDAYKIEIQDYPPKVSILNKLEVREGGYINYYGYNSAKEKWHNMLSAALNESTIYQTAPYIICFKFYVPKICDIDNFMTKLITDVLVQYKIIEDCPSNINVGVRTAVLDTKSPRTEINIIPNNGQIEDYLLTNTNI